MIILVGIIVVAVVGWLLWRTVQKSALPEVPTDTASIGAEISGAATGNPADSLPQTNPFESKTNPFEGAYNNPFGE
ncbi:MAG: hypothetical protein Q7R62_01920 [bacterium]|nr:hypothetical protein [bacterium]